MLGSPADGAGMAVNVSNDASTSWPSLGMVETPQSVKTQWIEFQRFSREIAMLRTSCSWPNKKGRTFEGQY
jgi:hypothetical protein